MPKIRNLTPGILHIPAAKVRLQGYAIAEVAEITPEIQKQIDAARVAIVADDEVVEAHAPTLPEPPEDYQKMDEPEAIEYVGDETDPKVIKTIFRTEQRGGVINALRERMKEIEDARK